MKNNSILLLGATGQLGSKIIESNYFKNCLKPTSKILNIKDINSIKKYFKRQNFNTIIHSAAISSMAKCQNNPDEAILTNIIGTQNLIEVIKAQKKKINLIYISTDGVYPPNKGNNFEEDKLKPYNVYCITKFCAENLVKTLNTYTIIRTRFFDKDNLKYKSYATDIYTSSIEISELVSYIEKLIKIKFKGIINIGDKKDSNYNKVKQYKNNINKCNYRDLIKEINFVIAKDASMNLTKMKKIFKND